MDYHVKEFFSQFHDDTPKGNFHKVIPLHEEKLSWNAVVKLFPDMQKGWYELSHLNVKDRIGFTLDFWIAQLPYHPKICEFLTHFFNGLDDIGIYLSQRTFDSPYEAHMVYSLKGDAGFFKGCLPATDNEIDELKNRFPQFILPSDYVDFLKIHNGFSKTTDTTGIIPTFRMPTSYSDFQALIVEEGLLTTNRGTSIDPRKLLPFYESFGMPFYQCFWSEWYPEQEMGNVYYSDLTKSISDVECSDPSAEGMAFPTFSDWLMFYMEPVSQ